MAGQVYEIYRKNQINMMGGPDYWNREEAIDAVHRNIIDMHETIYPYVLTAATPENRSLFLLERTALLLQEQMLSCRQDSSSVAAPVMLLS